MKSHGNIYKYLPLTCAAILFSAFFPGNAWAQG